MMAPCADPRVAEDQQVILSKLENCEFDAIFDVRSQDYYDNWRLSGGEHLPDASRFDASRLAAENITSVAFYCWNAPWQSEPAAQWFASQYGDQGVAVYDIKGLTYLDDIPGMCQYIDGDDAAVAEHSPHCVEEGGVGGRGRRDRSHCGRPASPQPAPASSGGSRDKAFVIAAAVVLVLVTAGAAVTCFVHLRKSAAGPAPQTAGKLADGKLADPWADGNGQDDLAKPQDVEKGQQDAQVLSVVPAELPGAPEPQESAEPEP